MSETTEAPATEATDTPNPAPAEGTQTTEAPAAPAAPEQPAAPPEQPQEPQSKPGAAWQKRIDEVIRQRAEFERKAQAYERELEQYRQQKPADGAAQPQQPQNLTDAQIEQRARKIADEERYREKVGSTIAAGQEKYGANQFNEACNTLASLGANEQPAFMQAVTKLDHGAEVLHHLGSNPELAARMMNMDALSLVREMTKLEAKITAPAAPKPISRAPSPISPIAVGHEVDENVEPDPAENPKAYMAWVSKRVARR